MRSFSRQKKFLFLPSYGLLKNVKVTDLKMTFKNPEIIRVDSFAKRHLLSNIKSFKIPNFEFSNSKTQQYFLNMNPFGKPNTQDRSRIYGFSNMRKVLSFLCANGKEKFISLKKDPTYRNEFLQFSLYFLLCLTCNTFLFNWNKNSLLLKLKKKLTIRFSFPVLMWISQNYIWNFLQIIYYLFFFLFEIKIKFSLGNNF